MKQYISDLERPAASIDRISFTVSRGTVISSIPPGRARQSNRPGKPYGEGRAPGPRGVALLLKLLNFSCSRCSFPSGYSDHFLVNINITHEMSERPPVVARRSRIGDREGDTVAGREGGACLVTQVDRRSGHLVGGKAAHKTSAEVGGVTMGALAGMVVRTVTVDRWSEFACARACRRAWARPSASATPTSRGRGAPTRTPTGS